MMTPWLWRLPDDIWCLFISLPLVSPCLSPLPLEALSLSTKGTSVVWVFVSALLVVDRHH